MCVSGRLSRFVATFSLYISLAHKQYSDHIRLCPEGAWTGTFQSTIKGEKRGPCPAAAALVEFEVWVTEPNLVLGLGLGGQG